MSNGKVIVDIGANNGNDTDFYLKKGFNVISIEADPTLCDLISQRFQGYPRNRLTIINAAISDKPGEVELFVNLDHREWSSLARDSKATDASALTGCRTNFETHKVNAISLDDALKDIDNLYYVKIDIEGEELKAINSLTNNSNLPHYISFEVNCHRLEILKKLNELGYTEFQLVRQGHDHLQPPKLPSLEGDYVDIKFVDSMSGLFGKELPGEWMCYNDIKEHPKDVHPEFWGAWYDIHAKTTC